MADEEDEDDYMSDKLLQQIEDVRPGIPMKKTQERELQKTKRKLEQSRSNQWKKRHILEEEQRQEGLKKPLDESNKGFALLSKMGFKPGMTLGSQGQSSSEPALVEPIEVKLKTDGRGGLGMAAKNEADSKERVRKHLEEAARRDCGKMTVDFRRDKQSQYDERALRGDLHKSQRVCRQLELAMGLSKPKKKYHWPPAKEDDENSESESESSSDEEPVDETEMLRELTHHLRHEYFYCIWCGCKYDSEEDLDTSCPGGSRDVHDE